MGRLYVIMGVAGSGKSLIGSMVAKAIGGTYIDGDDFHPETNVAKMGSGIPLSDEDRWPWLEAIATELVSISGVGLIGCSALKRSYRDFIKHKAVESIVFIFLSGSRELLAKRIGSREGHFMPSKLLDSQLATLEIPSEEENVITVDIGATPVEITNSISTEIHRIVNGDTNVE